MLIDNRTQSQNGQPTTIIEYLENNLDQGQETFKMVTGYYSLQSLAKLLSILDKYQNLELVLGHIAGDNTNSEKFYLTEDSLKITDSLDFIHKIPKILEFLKQGKVKIKTTNPEFCHAKMYLALSKNDYKNNFAISGSSNFTPSGLGQIPSSNIELNHIFEAGDNSIPELKNWFESLYQKATDNKSEVLADIEKYYKNEYTPEDIYNKIIFHLFIQDFNNNQAINQEIQDNKKLSESIIWNKLYNFQQKGAIGLIQKLEKYNFALLGDGVGLGKTWQTLAVIKYYLSKGSKVLVISPKKLEQNWKKYQYKFEQESDIFYEDELNYDFIPMSQLRYKRDENGMIIHDKKRFDRYDLVVIDESHNFRNNKTDSYTYLTDKILKGRNISKVLLLSATPLNNEVKDVRNQFELGFKHPQNSFRNYFDSDLENIFKKLQEVLNKAEKDKLSTKEKIQNIIQETKFLELINSLCIARNRSVITKFYGENQIKFPKARVGWQPLEIFEKAVEILMDKDKPKIKFNIYKVSHYLSKEEKEKYKSGKATENEIQREGFLSKMMMVNLIKRLESSIYAFDKTLSRIIQYHDYILKLDELYTKSKTQTNNLKMEKLFEDSYQDQSELNFDEDTEDEEYQELLEEMSNFGKNIKDQIKRLQENPNLIANGYLIGGKKQVNIKELKNSRSIYIKNIKTEREKLLEIQTQMKQEYGFNELDIKIVKLKQIIKTKLQENPDKKILIFTTYSDTADYIYQNLQACDFIDSQKLEKVTGSTNNIDSILKRFSPDSMLYNELNKTEKEKYKDFNDFWQSYNGIEKAKPIQILIGTDCISEGQNLQDCDFLINFDIHWNPVRLVQRNGRIDRIGSKFDSVEIKNFLPGKSLEDVLKIKSRLDYKMALVGMVGGSDADPVLDKQTQEMVDFWQEKAESLNQDLSQFNKDQVEKICQQTTEPEKYKEIYEQIIKGSLADYRELEMLKLMQEDYASIDENELSIKNFSLDQYQVELSKLLIEKSGIKNYPSGIYSGVKGDSDEVIFLLKSKLKLNQIEEEKHKKANPKHPYLMYHLDLEGSILKRYTQLPEILEHLKKLKSQDRFISEVNQPNQSLDKFTNLLKTTTLNYNKDFQVKEINNLFSGGVLGSENSKSSNLNDFELIAWMIISKA